MHHEHSVRAITLPLQKQSKLTQNANEQECFHKTFSSDF